MLHDLLCEYVKIKLHRQNNISFHISKRFVSFSHNNMGHISMMQGNPDRLQVRMCQSTISTKSQCLSTKCSADVNEANTLCGQKVDEAVGGIIYFLGGLVLRCWHLCDMSPVSGDCYWSGATRHLMGDITSS